MADGVRDEEGVRQFVEHMAMLLYDLGFPKMPGRVLTVMMTADEGVLSAGELAERLDVSPAAISGAVRYLMQLNMIVRQPSPGSRRELYRLPEHSWYEASMTKRQGLAELADIADDGIDVLGGEATPAGQRIAEMRDFFRFVQAEIEQLVARYRASRP